MKTKKKWQVKKAQVGTGSSPASSNFGDRDLSRGSLQTEGNSLLDEDEKKTLQQLLAKSKGLDIGAAGNSINLSGDGGIYDLMQLSEGINKIGNNKGFEAAIGKTTGLKKGLNTFFSVFNPLSRITTNVANTVTNYKNKKEEQQQYLEALQNRNYENFNEDGLNSSPIFFKFGGSSQYVEGQEYDVPTEEIKRLRRLGYKISLL